MQKFELSTPQPPPTVQTLPSRHRHRCCRLLTNVAMAGVPFVTAAFFLWAAGRSRIHRQPARCSSSFSGAATSSLNYSAAAESNNVRTKQTVADLYFQQYKKLPLPKQVHTTLPELIQNAPNTRRTEEVPPDESIDCVAGPSKNILVIGDVHGCYDEMLLLHDKAVQENGAPFDYVIFVGDLCNKGPKSAQVVRHVRLTPNWFSVRGNHDDGALQAALGDKDKLKKEKYNWIKESDDDDNTPKQGKRESVVLSDDDITWLSELPYTITIPRDYTGDDQDTVIVHAGLVPETSLDEQEIDTMITVRDVTVKCDDHGKFNHFNPKEKGKKKAIVAESPEAAKECDARVTWASAWFGPQRVIFGHNAKRRLQMYPGHWAIGLDTGAVYGGELTGLILPGRKLVSIQSKEYSPKGDNKSKAKAKSSEDSNNDDDQTL